MFLKIFRSGKKMLTHKERKRLIDKIIELEGALKALSIICCNDFDSCAVCDEECHHCGATKSEHQLADEARKLIK